MIPFSPLFENAWSVGGVTGGAPPAQLAEWIGLLFDMCMAGRSVRTSDRRFSLAMPRFLPSLHERRNIGKLLLEIDPEA